MSHATPPEGRHTASMATREGGEGMALPNLGAGGTEGEGPGDWIGPYKLLEIVGEGGFGVVWLAEQREPIARRVALKLLKLGMDTRAVIARFEQERQALALMAHPHIAKVYDAGTTDRGRLYFVMEHVKGSPITDYCDRARLTISQRLALFAKVCDAIQHAHTKGIIHRDLKPGNILVAAGEAGAGGDGGEARPVVIDFGVAKAVASRLTEKTIYTTHGQLIGTPEYMSPEQAEMAETDIDTRTDIYALGVILYELLTGALPFDPGTLRSAGYGAIQKLIREVDPPRPSTRLSSLGAEATKVAEARRVAPRELASDLKHELEWIPLKAMRKERTERYRTASELADDIANYLSHRPLLAGPESAAYRVRKFAWRNRVGVLAGAAVLAALLLGMAGTAWQAIEASRQRDAAKASEQRSIADKEEAQRQRDAAEASRMTAELIAQFMSDTLEGAGPAVARGRDTTMLQEMMDAAAARIEKGDLQDAPEAELRLRETIGGTYRELALYDAAHKMLEPAVDLARATHQGDHEDTARALGELASLRLARSDMAGAESLFRESLEMRKRLFTRDHKSVANALSNLARVYVTRRDLAQAEPLYRESLEMRKRLSRGDDLLVANTMIDLAIVRQGRGALAEAEPLQREALDMLRRLIHGDHPSVAAAIYNLARLRHTRRELAEAEPLYRDALDMLQRVYPGDHPNTAVAISNYAELLKDSGKLTDAEPLYRKALDMYRRLYPGDNMKVANTLTGMAGLALTRGDPTAAEPLASEATAIFERVLGRDNVYTANARMSLGYTLRELHRYPEAERELLEAERVLSTAQGVPSGRREQCVQTLVTLYDMWHKSEPEMGYDAKAAAWKAKLDAAKTEPASDAAR